MVEQATTHIMTIRDVYKTYQMGEVEVPVLRGVDLDIHEEELLIILGESGSGKSTLLNLIGGIDAPTRGSLLFDEQDLGTLNDRELTTYRRHHVGFVFQTYNLVPSLTAIENVHVAADIAANPRDPAETLALVGLAERARHFPSQLSGGEQQRVAIARALAGSPRLLLCDEPTGALDHETSLRILDLLRALAEQTGTTVVMITHSKPMAGMANRVVMLADGKVASIHENDRPRAPRDLDW